MKKVILLSVLFLFLTSCMSDRVSQNISQSTNDIPISLGVGFSNPKLSTSVSLTSTRDTSLFIFSYNQTKTLPQSHTYQLKIKAVYFDGTVRLDTVRLVELPQSSLIKSILVVATLEGYLLDISY